jgi:hypothetical protein
LGRRENLAGDLIMSHFKMKLKQSLSFLFILFGVGFAFGQQNTNGKNSIDFSNQIDKLIIEKTTLIETKKILGQPSREIKFPPSQTEHSIGYELRYDSLKLILNYKYKTKILTSLQLKMDLY